VVEAIGGLDDFALRAARTARNHRRWGYVLLGAAGLLTVSWGMVILASALTPGLHLSGSLFAIAVCLLVVAPLAISGRYRFEAARQEGRGGTFM
jgi:hypothetical protein